MLSLDIQASTPSPELAQNARVLVVEDEDLIREMVVLSLREEGYEGTTAADGRTALNLLQGGSDPRGSKNIFPFDLVLLDLMLPQVKGLDLCRWLRLQGNIVPVMILSAKASETDRVLGLEVGADDYLTKPFSMPELLARCGALLGRSVSAASPKLRYCSIAT